ncbi:MAG: hypothetical protein R2880_14215 [Deinococcales bacterium]
MLSALLAPFAWLAWARILGRSFCYLSLSSFFIFGLAQDAEAVTQPLVTRLIVGWDLNQSALSAYPANDMIPVLGQMNRNVYVYFFVVQPNGGVQMNYPANSSATDNVIYGDSDQVFLRFVNSGVTEGIFTFYLISALRPLTPPT